MSCHQYHFAHAARASCRCRCRRRHQRASTVRAAARPPTRIRPFTFNAPEEEIGELRRRIASTRWPEQETVTDAIARRATRDDAETRALLGRPTTTGAGARRSSTALPNFITEIDGLDIHFIHVRSKHENALPRHRHARLARIGRRAAENHRSARQIPRRMAGARRMLSTW